MPILQMIGILFLVLLVTGLGGLILGPLLIPLLVLLAVGVVVGAPVYYWVKGESEKATWLTVFSVLLGLSLIPGPNLLAIPAAFCVGIWLIIVFTSKPAP